MLNIGGMMKQMQDMKVKMADMQARLDETEVEGQSGSGLVQVTMNGKGEMKKIKLDAKLIDPAEIEMLEDLIVAACNDAKQKAEAQISTETEKVIGRLKLPPGMKLPF